ncbi:MAG: glutamate synthase subunit beta [Bacteroidota bacterium]|nr:glutamate synthase subunit beta [Bacteroidota bacterium]MDP4191208.1 glutamate synthase subunit beta [Bacteroidota bacterium]MDP4194706.1 glutamate synthase subunit beta [Bacteroidota bacterium]
MGEVKGFLKYKRKGFEKETVEQRTKHFNEFVKLLPDENLREQGARCMDCGIPFCQSGCPIGNVIPDWNDLVYNDKWYFALERLLSTNNFPEFTGRLCPALCENSCVLAINQPAVTIKNIELAIIEKAYSEGWIKPKAPKFRTGRKVAIIGSGPSGLACADQLNKYGHFVTVFEKNEKPGGLLALGIPDFKLDKKVISRRIAIMEEEGIIFKTGINVGYDISVKELKRKFDAVVLCGGAEQPRDLPVPGRGLDGIYFALQFLSQQNRVNAGWDIDPLKLINAKGKRVVVLGGGDTGSDCIGTSIRQGAVSVQNFELLSPPPKERASDNPWPQWAFIQRTSTSHEEGCEREYLVLTKKFSGEQGKVKKLHCVKVEFTPKDSITGRREMREIPGSEFEVKADLVLLALGFLGPVKTGLISDLKLELDERGNVKTDANFMSSVPGIFSAGDMHRGQSLVVWAIKEGRNAAEGVNRFLS